LPIKAGSSLSAQVSAKEAYHVEKNIRARDPAAAIGGVSAQAADQTFTVRIENVSAANALKLSNGKAEPVGVAPVLYVIHTNRAPLFTSGEPDRGKGLEALAEDGPTGPLEKSLKGQPGIVHVGSTDTPVGASSAGV